MTQPVNGSPQAQGVSGGYFDIGGQKITFQDMVVMMGFMSLEAQDKTFEAMFNEAQERTEFMNKLNDCLQMCNKYKDYFDKDGNAKKKGGYTGGDGKLAGFTPEDKEKWLNDYYPALVESGLVQDSGWSPTNPDAGIGHDAIFTKQELETFIENAKLAQTNLSSTNEQQMIRTNQAANKRGTILQQLQTLLGATKEGMTSAAR